MAAFSTSDDAHHRTCNRDGAMPRPRPRCRSIRPGLALGLSLTAALATAPFSQAQCSSHWVPGVGTPGSDGRVFSMTVTPPSSAWNGDVIVGGNFSHAGGAQRNGIARYAPGTNTWSGVDSGSGFNSGISEFVFATVVLPGGDMLVGGQFSSAGGAPIRGLARLGVGTGTWSAVGGGLSGSPLAVYGLHLLPDGDVLVGGYFATAGGVTANNVARYHPTTDTWSAMQGGVTMSGAPVVPVAGGFLPLPDGDVIVTGIFSTAGGVPTSNLARYAPSTNTWSAIAPCPSLNAGPCVVLPGGDLITAPSRPTGAGGQIISEIFRYHPAADAWTSPGILADGWINVMSALPNGEVIIGGAFSHIGNVAAARIARYNPAANTCAPVSSGVNAEVYAITVLPGGSVGDVLVGGMFTSAGGANSQHIARFSLDRACAPDFDCSGAPGIPDVFGFLNAWFALDVSADFNGVFGINIQDIFDFLSAWFAGC